ncbi:MAG: UDP-N-acetylmuramoyl-tripeptide--D-alanyl-D-alanine ligase [Roseovarius sp. BRH_c41]|uniref:UDP-N-acetylmuramoyl-tripeptide--D-alanyl-D- alanine ligase n=1 Tax=Roseovarius sp. BRH_c41 TaxID=1629709 RepID=UPI0005F0E2FA|nr:UDP-N-acetylmuramoyl-tripeptide--D-alanyl-D-alanine ligase [Roseovarius sp. BRH_c41]KJS43954.1 MAG: UDP-N-acetylmuramoyl-tripeptide--D-alanyl-D-alanine ligase [Roseovarius sp. BRH_c41]
MSLWSAQEAAAATGGRVTGDWQVSGVSIDTRTLQRGDLFVALSAARDGHEFVAQALAKGAAAALVSHVPEGVGGDAPLLLVADVQAGLEALGRAGRARSRAKVVAVTGSVGKTSTKEMLRDVLRHQGRTHAAEASYNNHWGVPLTLARMPVDTQFAVIEIGMNHPGEIAPLARMARPHVAVITTVAAAHLEAFEDIEGIAREKASIFEGLEPGGVAVINADIATAPILRAEAVRHAARILSFGTARGAHHRLLNVELHDRVTVGHARAWRSPLVYKVGVPGRHFAMNALAVLAVVQVLGCDRAVAMADLAGWAPPAGRGTREELVLDLASDGMSIDLIDDAFNANPTSMAAALEVLAAAQPRDGVGRVARGRRIAILGDMLELGADEVAMHAGLADLPYMAQIDEIHCVGPRMRALWELLSEGRQGRWAATAEDLAAQAHRLIDAGDVVLVKGSKGSRVSLVVEALRRAGRVAEEG